MDTFNDITCELIEKWGESCVYKVELVGDSILLVSKYVLHMIIICKEFLKMFDALKTKLFMDSLIDIRIGVHVGNIVGGILKKQDKYQIYGQVVNIASRLEQLGTAWNSLEQLGTAWNSLEQLGIPGTIHVSDTVYELIKENESLISNFSIGQTKLCNLKGIGNFNSMTMFAKAENCLLADDNNMQLLILKHIINNQNNTTSIQVTSLSECFKILKKQYFEDVVVLDRFFENEDSFELLRNFRCWESQNRSDIQKFILISAQDVTTVSLKTMCQDDCSYHASNVHLDDVFIHKNKFFINNFNEAFKLIREPIDKRKTKSLDHDSRRYK
jgi:CheY-like chemotaxis protein